MEEEIKDLIRVVPDFPKPGILFRDITPLLQDGQAFQKAVEILSEKCPKETKGIAAIESRGFILGGALSEKLGVGFIPIRKKGKLPHLVNTVRYQLEYGFDTLEIHQDALSKGKEVVLIDDLLATGGTSEASVRLVEGLGGKILKILFLIELVDLKGREKLKNYSLFSLFKF